MNTNPAWSNAGVGQQTRHVAEEAARRAGMRVEEWLDEAIEQAAGSGARSEERYGEDAWADAVDRRLDRISCRERVAHNPEFYRDGSRGRDDEDLLGSTIERFE